MCRLLSRLMSYDNKYHCPVCGGQFRFLLPNKAKTRLNAVCPRCRSYERHRLVWLYLKNRTNLFQAKLRILHCAPEKCFWQRFMKMQNLHYISVDLSAPRAMLKMDITNAAFRDNTFDCILCLHVLEHIEQDVKVIKELYRVLKYGGWAILQVPIEGNATFEDMSIQTPAGRLKYFDQEDHVRKYGFDFKDRLIAAGFTVNVDRYLFGLDENTINRFRLVPESNSKECIYFCSK